MTGDAGLTYDSTTGVLRLGTDNTTGNLGLGYLVLGSRTTGTNDVCIGPAACMSLTTGVSNVAIGKEALIYATTGSNIAIGPDALGNCVTCTGNIALGQGAGQNTTGNYNTLLGTEAAFFGYAASETVYVGFEAGQWMVGDGNTGIGAAALYGPDSSEHTATGSQNVAIGHNSGVWSDLSGSGSPAFALTTGNNNTFVGAYSGFGSATQRTNSAAFGYNATVDADNTIVLGNAAITDVYANRTGTAAVHGYATGLKSATTSVSVSSATAPSVGQILTATSPTAATWQDPTGGSGGAISGATAGGVLVANAGTTGTTDPGFSYLATGATIRQYNLGNDAATDYERVKSGWNGSDFETKYEYGGTGDPYYKNFRWTAASAGQFSWDSGGNQLTWTQGSLIPYYGAPVLGSTSWPWTGAYIQALHLVTASAPTCDATVRGQINYTAGGTGVQDIVQVCAKDATDTYAWRTIY